VRALRSKRSVSGQKKETHFVQIDKLPAVQEAIKVPQEQRQVTFRWRVQNLMRKTKGNTIVCEGNKQQKTKRNRTTTATNYVHGDGFGGPGQKVVPLQRTHNVCEKSHMKQPQHSHATHVQRWWHGGRTTASPPLSLA
jgi:hypothetical protein